MQRYESYKPTTIEWAPAIPAAWDTQPIRALFNERKERNDGPKTDFILSVMKDIGIIPYDEKGNVGNKKSENIENYKVVYPGDLVVNKMNAIIGSLGISRYIGALSQIYFVLYPKDHSRTNHKYLGYIFKVKPFQQSLIKISKGMMELRESIEFDEFKKLVLPVPPIDEQDRIVAFLDQKTAEIDAAIAKKERLIELLNEQKHTLINRAITCGLNPAVSLQYSGFPWIGLIPTHWNTLRFKYCSSITSGQVDPRREPYASMPLIAPNHIESGSGKLLQIETAREQGADSGKYQLEAGDLVYSKIRPALRKACLSPVAGLCSADMYVLRPKDFINKRYLLGYLLTDAFTLPALDAALRVAMPKVNREALGDFPVLVPPLDEQEAIADFMLTCDERFNPVIDAAKGEVAKLSELRALLISSAVSGKLRT